jgi:HD superfamily phosphohydrolase
MRRAAGLPVAGKRIHEIRDPIHVFIHLDNEDRQFLDSEPVQRLRHISQLAMTPLVYPGACHTRFEHSLGVMHVADRIFSLVIQPGSRYSGDSVVRDLLDANLQNESDRAYWRKTVRLAALCHDIGHLPFSHATEDLLPEGMTHESIAVDLIFNSGLKDLWSTALRLSGVDPMHVAKIALGEKSAAKVFGATKTFTAWERVLSEIITGDIFGADRIDYLLLDSHHTGVAYGRFDHNRLIETLRLLPEESDSDVVVLGVQGGGIHSAEALLLARYFMFSQVYFHPIRQIYDTHLTDFLKAAFADGRLHSRHQEFTDHEVVAAMHEAARDASALGHDAARRIVNRDHFKVLYKRNAEDANKNPQALAQITAAAQEKFGAGNIRYVPTERAASGPIAFPVEDDGKVMRSDIVSEVIVQIPPIYANYVYINRELLDDGRKWLDKEKDHVIALETEKDE